MKKLTPTPEGQKPLYVVEVPKEILEFRVNFDGWFCYKDKSGMESFWWPHEKLKFRANIIGAATLEGADFDVEPYLIKVMAGFSNYSKSPGYFVEPEKSFASLLRANGCTNKEVNMLFYKDATNRTIKNRQRTETVKGRVLGEIKWNKDLSVIVSDTVNLYHRETDSWVEIVCFLCGEKVKIR